MAALLSIQKAKVLHCTQWSQDAAVGFPFPEPSTRNDQLRRTRAHAILSELLADSKLSASEGDCILGTSSHKEVLAKTGSIAQYQLRCLGNVVPCHDSQDGNSHWPVSCS